MPNLATLAVLEDPIWFEWAVAWASRVIESIGIVIILLGGLYALATAAFHKAKAEARYRELRRRLGRSILLGLEFLVAADIIATVFVDPTFQSAAFLGFIVLIRTFLSWTLELEIEGRWPWQKQVAAHEDTPAPAKHPRGQVGRVGLAPP